MWMCVRVCVFYMLDAIRTCSRCIVKKSTKLLNGTGVCVCVSDIFLFVIELCVLIEIGTIENSYPQAQPKIRPT